MNKALSTIPTFLRRTLLAACIAAGAVTVAAHSVAAPWSFGGEQVQGSGRIVKQERQVGNFNGLSLEVPAHVELRIGSSEGVTIDADALRARRLQIDIGGSGSINLKGVESDALSVSLGGSGDLQAGPGTVGKLSVSIGGSGDVDLGRVQATSAKIAVAGSGEATAWVRNELSVSIAGSGDVNYYGDPRISKSTVGSGDVRRLGAAPQ